MNQGEGLVPHGDRGTTSKCCRTIRKRWEREIMVMQGWNGQDKKKEAEAVMRWWRGETMPRRLLQLIFRRIIG
jgi:hypothetical protein